MQNFSTTSNTKSNGWKAFQTYGNLQWPGIFLFSWNSFCGICGFPVFGMQASLLLLQLHLQISNFAFFLHTWMTSLCGLVCLSCAITFLSDWVYDFQVGIYICIYTYLINKSKKKKNIYIYILTWSTNQSQITTNQKSMLAGSLEVSHFQWNRCFCYFPLLFPFQDLR